MESHQLLLLFLAIITDPLQAQSRAATMPSTSSKLVTFLQPQPDQLCTSSCAYLTNITYPFRLSTDPPACGDPGYEITCRDGRSPILSFHSQDFLVKQISYTTYTIRLLETNLSNATCTVPSGSLSLNQLTEDPRYRGHASNTYTSFFRCSKGTNLTARAYRRVPCPGEDDGEVYVSYGTYIISGLQGSCEFISRVPTIYQPVLYPSYGSIVELLQSGFDLGWSVECRNCVEDGGTCVLTSWDTPFVYGCRLRGDSVATIVGMVFYVLWTGLLGINLIARFIIAPIVIIGFLVHKYHITKKATDRQDDNILLSQRSFVVRRYFYPDIISITNQFKDKIGKGGYGTVYRGQLADGQFVAVKMLDRTKVNEEDFMKEVSMIARICHVNVARLLGICYDDSHRALVLEYMPNGSLEKYIFARKLVQPLSWEKLLEILLGTARGIEHLHTGCDARILHLDIKPQNVLLDLNLVPKVCDFGLANFCPKEADFVSVISARGTMRYIAPELISSGHPAAASCKSDIYSFGMLLLEVVRGKKNADAKGNCSNGVYFPSWIYEHLSGGGDLDLENATITDAAIAKKLCLVGLSCIQKEPQDRPSISKVLQMLEGNGNDLELPLNSLSFPERTYFEEPQSDSSTELLITEAGKHQPVR